MGIIAGHNDEDATFLSASSFKQMGKIPSALFSLSSCSIRGRREKLKQKGKEQIYIILILSRN